MTKQRSILGVVEVPATRHGPGLTTHDVGEDIVGRTIDPYVAVSLYDMAGPTFPPHPHAGFAVATYILPESPIGFVNQDSIGNRNPIPPGALHVTVAGSGVLHEEEPERTGSLARGYQIWIDLKNGSRMVAPHALHLAAKDVPVVTRDGVTIRAVLGASNGATSPLKLPTDLRLIDVALAPSASFTQTLAREENTFIVMIEGEALVNGSRARAGEAVRTAADGETLDVIAAAHGARFTLFAGKPFNQTRAQRGPMVAGDNAELQRLMNSYAAGEFGRLTPFSAQRVAG